ncbi:MAG TPA: PAS domain-containing protein [Solirubrobacterales bacterium]
MEASQRPLELILARNLLTAISTPAFLVDDDAQLLFYNEAAGALLGVSFEEAGRMSAEKWTARFGPFERDGRPVSVEELELTKALREGRPAHATFCIRGGDGEKHPIEASALPISGNLDGDNSGAIVVFWPNGDSGSGR